MFCWLEDCCSGLGAALRRLLLLPTPAAEEACRLSLELFPRKARRLSASVLCVCDCCFDLDTAKVDSVDATPPAAAAAAAKRLDEDDSDEAC